MFVACKKSKDPTVFAPIDFPEKFVTAAAPRIVSGLERLFCGPAITFRSFSVVRSGLGARCESASPDIIQLHWVGKETISIEEIGEIQVPLVWRLADMWPFCGAEHYTDKPEAFECNSLDGRPPPALAWSDRWVWERKRRAWRQHIEIVCTTQWMCKQVRANGLFKRNRITVIPNCLDITQWRPVNKEIARASLSISNSERVIAFGAIGGTSDPRKGGDLLRQSLIELYSSGIRNVRLAIFGQAKSNNEYPYPCSFLGHIHDDSALVSLYSAADLVVVPSRQESFGQIASEALACGTPVVAFAVGGLREVVDHQINGYLAEPCDAKNMATGIAWVLKNSGSIMSSAARQKAIRCYSSKVVAQQYSSLYSSILSKRDHYGARAI